MSDSYEIEKKQCPEGFHSHPNNTRCHPINQPHRPGSKAEKEHFDLGLENSWYEQHGTTREEYEKERAGEESKEKTPEEEPKTPEKEPEETPEGESVKDPEEEEGTPKEEEPTEESQLDPDRPLDSKVQWGAIKNMRKGNEERFRKISEARSRFESIKDDDSMTGAEKFDEVMKIATGYDDDKFIHDNGVPYINNAPREVQNDLISSILSAMEMNPLLISTYKSGIHIDTTVSDGTMMYYSSGLNNISVASKELKGLVNEEDPSTVKDPLTKEQTDWDLHFKGSTNINAICHESGHAVSSTCNALNYLAVPGHHEKEDCQRILEDNGVQGIAIYSTEDDDGSKMLKMDASYDLEDVGEFSRAKEVLESMGYKVIERDAERSEYDGEMYPTYEIQLSARKKKEKIQEFYDRYRTPQDIEKLKEKFGADSSYVRLVESKERDKDRSFEGFLDSEIMDNGGHPISGRFGVQRVKECEELYKKLYGVKKIVPSECYSSYGYYGEAIWIRTNEQAKQKRLNALIADERFAEAYSDVVVRGDKANSMSKLLVAHSYYELAQLQDGYEGSFEDYIRDFMGDSLKERIIKMNHNTFISTVSSDEGYILIHENDNGTGLFIHKGQSIILKRCKRGFWKHPETGECVPKELLLNQPKKPREKKEEPAKESPKPKKERESECSRLYRYQSRMYEITPNPVTRLEKELTQEQIIDKLCVEDDPWGCCASVSLAYIGNLFGYDVEDFRSKRSRNLFCDNDNIHYLTRFAGGKVLKGDPIMKTYERIFKKYVEDGKQYYFGAGEHVAIIRRHEGQMQYLELQGFEGGRNGWHTLDEEALRQRFGCYISKWVSPRKDRWKDTFDLFDIEGLRDNKEFETLLSYLNSKGEGRGIDGVL